MEKKCTSDIKAHQANIKQEAKRQKDDLEQWEKLRRNNDVEGALNKEFIIKSIYDKAREKNKEQMKETEDDKD